MGHFGAANKWGGYKRHHPHPYPDLKSVTHIPQCHDDETWHRYTLPKGEP